MENDFSRRLKGFTLLELMISTSIIAVLVATAGPYMSQWIVKNRVDIEVADFRAGLGYARYTALNKNKWVTIRHRGNNWHNGWYIFEDNNHNGTEDNDDVRLKTHDGVPHSINIQWGRNVSKLSYGPRGVTNGGTQNIVRYCVLDDTVHKFAKGVVINAIGRTRVARGTVVGCRV